MFTLDPRLERDTLAFAESDTSLLRLFNDARYPWLVLIPRQPDAVEWFDLPSTLRRRVDDEVMVVGAALKSLGCTKVNIGALGNMVPQLHIHLIARMNGDPAWPGPVWGHSPATPLTDEAARSRMQQLRVHPGLVAHFRFCDTPVQG